MISTLRNKKKLTTVALWVVIAAFVGTIFFVWGMGDKVSEANFALSVDGITISDQEFQQKVDVARENFRRLFGNNADELIKDDMIEKTVMQQLITEAVLKNEAERLNVPVSDSEVAAYVQSMQAFQNDGVFDMQRYTDLLARNRMTPQIFETGVRSDITVQKMTDIIKKSVAVTDKEIESEYIYRNSKAEISYIEFDADSVLADVSATPDELKKYYDKNKEEYRVPEKADFKVLVFDPASFQPNINVSDAEVEDYFIKNKASLVRPEEVRASHILLKVENWKNESEANGQFQKAKSVLEELKKGADFAEAAKKYSADSSAQNGGDLGFFQKGQMVVPFEAAAFKLKPGEISDIVKTQYGFHIIKVFEHKAETNPTIEQAREGIKQTIAQEKAKASFRNAVYEKYKEIVNASNLTAFNMKNGNKLPITEVRGVTASGEGSPLAAMPDIAKKIMTLNKTEISQLIEVGERKFIFEMTEKHDSYIPKMAEISAVVEKDYKESKSLEAIKAKAAELSKSKDINAVATATGKEISNAPAFTRTEPISGLGLDNGLMDEVFNAKPGAFIKTPYVSGRKVYLIQVNSVTKPGMEKLAEQKEQIYSALLGVKSNEAFKDYVESLKSKAEIIISPRYEKYNVKK